MKFTATVQTITGALGTALVIAAPKSEEINKFDGKKKYSIEIKKPYRKRSLQANAYCWVLTQRIAEKLSQDGSYHSKEDVYRTCIKDCGHFVPVPVRDDVVDEWCRRWESKGLGWVSEVLGPCKNTKGYTIVAMYHGSSTYTVEEMTRLINCLIDEAQRLGVEIEPREYVDTLLQEWGEHDETQREKAKKIEQ